MKNVILEKVIMREVREEFPGNDLKDMMRCIAKVKNEYVRTALYSHFGKETAENIIFNVQAIGGDIVELMEFVDTLW